MAVGFRRICELGLLVRLRIIRWAGKVARYCWNIRSRQNWRELPQTPNGVGNLPGYFKAEQLLYRR